MMNDDIEQLLGRLTPRGVRPELRPQVLAAVASQLEAEPASPWLRRSALAVAASLLVGIAMNIWASHAAERRLARLFGPPPVSKQAMELANAVGEDHRRPNRPMGLPAVCRPASIRRRTCGLRGIQ